MANGASPDVVGLDPILNIITLDSRLYHGEKSNPSSHSSFTRHPATSSRDLEDLTRLHTISRRVQPCSFAFPSFCVFLFYLPFAPVLLSLFHVVTTEPHHFPETSFHRIIVLPECNFAESLFCRKSFDRIDTWPNRRTSETS